MNLRHGATPRATALANTHLERPTLRELRTRPQGTLLRPLVPGEEDKKGGGGDGLGDGPALQTLQSLETKPPLQATTSRRDKDCQEILALMGR